MNSSASLDVKAASPAFMASRALAASAVTLASPSSKAVAEKPALQEKGGLAVNQLVFMAGAKAVFAAKSVPAAFHKMAAKVASQIMAAAGHKTLLLALAAAQASGKAALTAAVLPASPVLMAAGPVAVKGVFAEGRKAADGTSTAAARAVFKRASRALVEASGEEGKADLAAALQVTRAAGFKNALPRATRCLLPRARE